MFLNEKPLPWSSCLWSSQSSELFPQLQSSRSTLPEPEDPQVRLRQVPARRIAAVRYSGFWSEKGYLRNKFELESWIHERGLITVGDPIWARYNPPFTLWFLRRNEILIPVDAGVCNVSETGN